MKSNRFLKAAAALWLAAVITTAVLGATQAKYTARAEGTALARVAVWDARLTPNREASSPWLSFWYNKTEPDGDSEKVTMTQPAPGANEGENERLFMFFKDPGDSYYFEFELDNRSEVAAWYHLRAVLPEGPDESKGTLPEMAVSCSCGQTIEETSVLLPQGDTCTVVVAITPGTPDANGHQSFTGLQIVADIEQAD